MRLAALATVVATYAVSSVAAAQGAPPITVEYDRFRNSTQVSFPTISLGEGMEVGAAYWVKGRKQAAPVPRISLHFASTGDEWQYLRFNEVTFLLDGKTRLSFATDSHDNTVGSGYVLEQFWIDLTRPQAAQIARARRVEMQVGINEFTWNDSLRAGLRQIVAMAAASTTPRSTYADENNSAATPTPAHPEPDAPQAESSNVGAYFEFQVEKPASSDPANPQPTYPPMLRAAGVSGHILAQVVIDTTGYADMSTFKILESSHELFSQAVREVFPRMRFTPAEIAGKKVRQVLQQPFTFAPGR